MKKIITFPALLLAVSLLAACSSMPKQNAQLEDARNDYASAQGNPDVVQLAQPELTEAGVALDKANTAAAAHENDETVNKLAYLAKQKIATTQEIAKRRAAERAVANADKERNEIRLAQRTAEVDRARNDATIAQNQAADAQQMAADSDARAQQLAAMLNELAAQKTERGMVITLGDVLFNVDQAELKPDGMRNVQKLADFMKRYPQRSVLIEGYTDSTGSAPHNMDLSRRRAESVSSALQVAGVPAARIATRGYGEGYPVAANDTASNRQLNRRVEIIVSDDNGRIVPR